MKMYNFFINIKKIEKSTLYTNNGNLYNKEC